MTSLTERYLAAALRGIPDRQRVDVERELRSSIADAMDDRVAAGEDQSAAESAVLEGLGSPSRLASEISGRPLYLIGPDLFVEYRQLLTVLIGIVVPIVGVVLASIQLGTGAGYGDALLEGIGGAWTVGMHIFFWVTLTFALVDRAESAKWGKTELRAATSWTVDKLPELPSPGRVGVGETIGEVLTLALSIVGLLFLRGFAPVTDAAGDPVPLLDPGLWTFWVPYLIAVLISIIGFEIVKLMVGRWTMGLAVAHAVLQAAFALPFAYLALSGAIINPDFAEAIGWPLLAEGNGPVMVITAASVLLVTAWEVVDGFRRARRV